MFLCRNGWQAAVTSVWLASAIATTPVQAFSLGGWDYAIGAFDNGTGGSIFEVHGIAIQQVNNQMIVALNANMPLTGTGDPVIPISWGDLFFNFSYLNSFNAANGQLWGIRFSPVSDSLVEVGVYRNVTARNVTAFNMGFSNLGEYSVAVGGNHQWGDLPAYDANPSYFDGQETGTWTILNSIATGTRVGDIQMLNASALAGLDFGYFGAKGSETIAFSFERPNDFVGEFIVSLMLECANDGIVIRSEAVPEPMTVLGLGLAAIGLGALQYRQKRQSDRV
ncbi:PEP-CTERM sorting domain-containing protein [Trichothermofontia sichuanensis B231]|uniref:PEP-CTERM sorting domain-containing protein n=1 Tax=Trichothermofontia sichuanensis TaxID=3045816 RepID=UPI0022487144|nr:PEP-CTERM sorting domain-containing protein [Trichothermofontia sichuanensis]UZQ53644.1 PEP-CTERM sorting domain-containing protein [Trichothermofontia sichuanensis B231]